MLRRSLQFAWHFLRLPESHARRGSVAPGWRAGGPGDATLDVNTYLIAAVAALLVFMAAALRADNSRIERKLNAVLSHLEIQTPGTDDDFLQQLQEMVSQGHKIEAIKLYRKRTGVGLKEAKDAIDSLPRG